MIQKVQFMQLAFYDSHAAACVLVAVLAGRGCMQAADRHLSDSKSSTASEAFVDPIVFHSELAGECVTQESLEHPRVEGDAAAAQAAMLPPAFSLTWRARALCRLSWRMPMNCCQVHVTWRMLRPGHFLA